MDGAKGEDADPGRRAGRWTLDQFTDHGRVGKEPKERIITCVTELERATHSHRPGGQTRLGDAAEHDRAIAAAIPPVRRIPEEAVGGRHDAHVA